VDGVESEIFYQIVTRIVTEKSWRGDIAGWLEKEDQINYGCLARDG
jgi:hypothetical protein